MKYNRLVGAEKPTEKLNVDKKGPPTEPPPVTVCPEIKEANVISDYLINAKEANRLVYCRFGDKYITDLEKRKNSNITALNTPNMTVASCSYLINIKKLVEEHNIDGEKRDFKTMKTSSLFKGSSSAPTPYYKLKDSDDETLIFESRFESGNLLAAIKISDTEYDLVLQNDINTNGHTQWYFFRVGNTKLGKKVKFNILNLAKTDSLYNYGMRINTFSTKSQSQENIGWHRSGENINYFQNSYKKEMNRWGRNYYTFTFTA